MSYYNPYQPPMYNPQPNLQEQLAQMRQQQFQIPQQMAPIQQPQIQQSGMVWVRNKMEADVYPVAPNTAIALWDMSGPYVHRKETDVSGRPIVKTYKLVEVTEAPQQANVQNNDFITRKEFEDTLRQLFGEKGRFEKEEPVNE